MKRNPSVLWAPLLLFVCADVCGASRRIVERKGLWRISKRLSAAREHLSDVGPDVTVESGDSLRIAAVARVEFNAFTLCANLVREMRSSFLLINRAAFDLSRETTEYLYDHALGDLADPSPATVIDWSGLGCEVCPKGAVLIRASGSFDDRDAAVDLIFDPRVLALRNVPDALEVKE